jgi:hypothetical protein
VSSFQFRDRCRIRRVAVDVDHAWADPTSLGNGKLEEASGRDQIAIRREQEVDVSLAESMGL